MRIQFQTNSFTPPPYAYAIELEAAEAMDGLHVKFLLTYLDRDQLEEEEILEEGFSLNDDLQWSGILPAVWSERLRKTEQKLTLTEKVELEEEENYWHVETGKENGYPEEEEELLAFLQEIQQAILEADQLEAPLHITVIRLDRDEKKEYHFEGSFVHQKYAYNGKTQAWEELNHFLKDIYSGDFRPDQALQKTPVKNGLFINLGDGLWYELGKSYLIQPSLIQKYLN